MLLDARHAARTFLAQPGFTLAILLSLAVGIGANTAIFSVASALLLKPLPYPDAERLVILWNTSPGLGITEDWFSTAQYFDIKAGAGSFEDVAIAFGGNFTLTGDGEPERVGTLRVSSNLLPMLGARAELGRLLVPQDDVPGTTGSAVLGYGTWQRRYGGDPNVIGKALTLNGQPYEIVGVLAKGFDVPREVMPTLYGAERAELVVPFPLAANAATTRNREDFNIVAKLKPGARLEQARAELATITARLRREHPDFYPPNGGLTFVALPLREQIVGKVRGTLLVLVAAVAGVLLIACANVANLLLSRAIARQREMAVRAALGAGRARVVRQLLTESVVLAVAGGTLGVAFAWVCLVAIRALGVGSVPRLGAITIDGRVLLFTAAVSIAAGLLFGLVPALRLSRLDLHETLKEATRGASGTSAVWGRGQTTRRLLVVGELAIAVALLAGAGLLVRSFTQLRQVSPGFNPAGVLTFELTMAGRDYGEPPKVLAAYKQLWERLSALPGVTATGGVSALPLSDMMSWGPITVEGRAAPAGEKFINADQRIVAADYFLAMEIPLVEGRLLTEFDTTDTPRVVVIDEHMARQLWPDTDPVGKRVRTGGFDVTPDSPWMTVVGVVGRVKHDALDSEPRIAFYLPHLQFPTRALNVVVRTAGDPAGQAAAVRQALRAVDPDLPLYGLRTMTERVETSLARRRFIVLLLSLFALVALLLSTIGAYGVVAYLVSQGTRDIGVRMALGATPGAVVGMVVRQSLVLASAGIAVGLGVAALLTRFLSSMLFGVGALDPLTYASVAGGLLVVATLATAMPALRAARVAPTAALNSE